MKLIHRHSWVNLGIIVCLGLALSVLWFGATALHRGTKNINQRILLHDHSVPLPNVPDRGVWVWQSPQELTGKKLDDDLQLLKNNNINTVYITVSNYVDYSEMPSGQQKQTKINDFQNALKKFISESSKYNIGVHALAGDTSWGFPNYSYIQTLLLDFTREYNLTAASNERLQGLQFDIETYNNPQFKQDKRLALQEYLASLKLTIQKYQSDKDNFMLGYTVPYWYDDENGNIPEITVNNKTAPVIYHILDTLNVLQNAYVAVLDYRNVVDGTDGSIAHAQNEIVYASKYASNVKVIIGQETTKQQPNKITFYGKKQKDLAIALQRIAATLDSQKSFKGFAINDLNGFQALVQKE